MLALGTYLGGRSTVAKIASSPPSFLNFYPAKRQNQKGDQQKNAEHLFKKPWLHHTAKLMSA